MRRSEPVSNASCLSRRYLTGRAFCVQAHGFGERTGVGIHKCVAASLPLLLCLINGLWLTLLDQDREHQSCGNQGAQNSRCKPLGIAIEPSEYVICGG